MYKSLPHFIHLGIGITFFAALCSVNQVIWQLNSEMVFALTSSWFNPLGAQLAAGGALAVVVILAASTLPLSHFLLRLLGFWMLIIGPGFVALVGGIDIPTLARTWQAFKPLLSALFISAPWLCALSAWVDKRDLDNRDRPRRYAGSAS